ncbi:TonB-dependent receptor plug domain-containing protein [Deminuibacter soli]|uniref:TonB-dependent receptor plug domain-containing protein n=1 Tax=Deminuibacter soli TaxID=2291815 RepID=A0A3E1NQS6_9BACT|nr:TonB-dependent receptor plug domain-containing protein [Deminuibacter soli]RFM30282.1 hypothetical protein DXN05_04770 [Deminuibacter soli]
MKRLYAFLLAGLIPGLGAYAQKVDSVLAKLGEEFTQERAYLHFDKSVYAPGETIWFKAYLEAGILPSDISKNFYVDWIDASGNVLYHTATPIIDASAKGQFDIPASFKGQLIHVRAYTTWMQNFDSAFLFNKDLRVLQLSAKKPEAVTVKAEIKFLPEGGDLLNGVNGKVAFKATDQWGKPVAVKGSVRNSKGEKLDSLITKHDGMGFFNIDAKAGETYTAYWTDEQKQAHTTQLPAVKQTGATLKLSGFGNRKNFLVERTAEAPDELKTLYVVASMQQQLVYRARVDLSESVAIGGGIPTDNFPSGVMLVTLFTANWVPVAERACFINNQNYSFAPTLDVVGDTRRRAKNFIDIDVPDTVGANLSLAVIDGGVGTDTSDNIVSHLLLTSELKGPVYNPAAYFKNGSDSLKQQLDLVMLTNGWRKIDWESLMADKWPQLKYRRDSSYMSFLGKVYGTTPSQIREAGFINIIFKAKDSTQSMVFLPLASNGTFSQPDMIFFDTVKVYYQFNKKRDLAERAAVTFSTGLLPAPGTVANIPLFANWLLHDTTGLGRSRFFAAEQARLAKLLKETTLEGVTVKAKAKRPIDLLDDRYTSGLFKGGDAYQFDVGNDVVAQSSYSVFQYLQGRVAGLQISNATGGGSQASATWRGSTPTFYLDEMPTDAQQLQNISMSDVAYIKVFRPPFFGSFGGGSGGAIVVYTKKGGDVKAEPGKGLDSRLLPGYTPYKQFYSPNYSTTVSDEPDLRSTLYWNPYILTDPKNHHFTVEFYNNDISKKLTVVLEGVNKDGKFVHLVQTVE